MYNIKLDENVQNLLKHLRKHLVVAAGQLPDHYTIFSSLKQYSEELWQASLFFIFSPQEYMENKIQSVITDLGVKELYHPNLPENWLRLSFLLYMGSVFFHPTIFLLEAR